MSRPSLRLLGDRPQAQRRKLVEKLNRMIEELEQESPTAESSQAKVLLEFSRNGAIVPRWKLYDVFESDTVRRKAISRAKERLKKENLRLQACYQIVEVDTAEDR